MNLLPRMAILFVTALVVIFDQITKLSVKLHFFYGESIKVLGDFVRFTYIENPGMAFGIRIGGRYFFTVFAALATVIILIYLYRIRHDRFASRFSLALILGGAIGNLIDRLAYGQVIDFVDIGLGRTRWPVFNLADSCVTVGMIMLVVFVLFERDQPAAISNAAVFPDGRPTPSSEHDNWLDAKRKT